jgi:hypothetical protein
MTDEATKERLRSMTVEMLLEFRRGYLRTTGANTLEHWRIILDRMRQAARQTRNLDEWATKVQRRLQIPQLGSSGCSALLSLSHAVREADAWREFRTLVDRETGLLEAMARQIVEAAKAEKENGS